MYVHGKYERFVLFQDENKIMKYQERLMRFSLFIY